MTRWRTGPEAVAELRAWCSEHHVAISQLCREAEVNRSVLTRWSRGAEPQRRVWDRFTAARERLAPPPLADLLGG